ncbi:NlpC/P60 family protein [Paenibacillus sp. DYY-L-2]|uniref:NlpC/P60 family protein n=1 Tax=Paenibacillus sp. DYY-L-2 TaxID=3447013 RepID=UPI003F504A19
MNKAYRVVDHNQAIRNDKTGIHKESVRTSLDHSVKDNLIKSRDYSEGRKTAADSGQVNRTNGNRSYKNYAQQQPTPEQSPNQSVSQGGQRYRSDGSSPGSKTYSAERSREREDRNRGDVIGGAAGSATVAGMAHMLVNSDKSGIHTTFVNDAFGETVAKKMLNMTAFELNSHQIAGSQEARGIIHSAKSAGRGLAREMQSTIVDDDQGVAGRTRRLASRYGYRAGKYTLKSGRSMAGGTYRLARYTKQLAKDVQAGNISVKEAKLLGLKRGAGAVSAGTASVGKVIKLETMRGMQEFEGSEDLGLQAVTKTRDAILTTKRTVTTARRSAKAVGKGIKGTARMAQKAAIQLQQAARYVAAVARKAMASPVLIKAAGLIIAIVLIAALVMSVASAISSIIPTISLKSEDEELTKTYKYVTELDAKLEKELQDVPKENKGIDEFHYYLNGYEVDPASLRIETDADLILLFFDTKYNDYAFNKLIYGIFGGTNVQSEVEELHKKLYQLKKEKWSEKVSVTDDDGNTHTETIWHMDIRLEMKSFQTYLTENMDELLTEDEQTRMEALQTVGVYTVKKELGNPFPDKTWGYSSRFGWRVHPISGKLAEHNGADIAMPGGTPINNVLYGKVSTVAYDADGFGNYAVITWGEREVLYAHMSSVAVSEGQTLKKGEVVGYVGTTGSSTGNHLHIEYKKKGYTLNPQFYLEGASAGQGMTDEGATNLITYAEQFIGLPYVWGGSAPPTFDCSGFICWVFTHSGTRNLPRTTAQGIYNQTVKISESEAQPGDLVFFHHTYDSPNPITHVGIYVGNGQMLHAGDPIQYTSFHTPYWQKFNPVFGRLK